MAKLNAKQRIQTVIRYLNGIESMQDIAESVGVTRMILSGWIRLYEAQGPERFLQSYTNYSAAFKMEVLTYMNETGASSIDAAAIFNITSHGMVRDWKKKFEVGGYDALVPKKKGRLSMKKETKKSKKTATPTSTEKSVDSVKTLEARIKQLEMENAYLKKLNALVQSQEKLQPKSKRK